MNNAIGPIIIHCKDSHLTTINAQDGRYIDNLYGKNQVVMAPRNGETLAPGVTNACGGQNSAFTYSPGTLAAKSVIVLCSDSPAGALNSYSTLDLDNWRWTNIPRAPATSLGINFASTCLAYILAHEITHATDVLQCELLHVVSLQATLC